MASLIQRRGVRQFLKFGIVGASGFAVNLLLFTFLQLLVPKDQREHWYYAIFSAAYIGSGVSNYYLNRVWTFRSTGNALREGAQFLSVSALSLCVGLLVSALVSPYLGKGHKTWFVATVAGIFVNFFLNKYWTFRAAR